MRISDWSSDVCSSDLIRDAGLSDPVLIVRHQRISGKKSVDLMDHPGRVFDRAGFDHGDDDVEGVLVVLGQKAHGDAERGHWPAHAGWADELDRKSTPLNSSH